VKPVSSVKGKSSYIVYEKTEGVFPLSVSGQPAPLYVSSEDYQGVVRVARLLQADLGRVTGAEPELLVDKLSSAKEMLVIGTLGCNPIIDQLVHNKKLDVTDLARKRETFALQCIRNPLPQVERALVIAGSDKRGTLYGMLDLSTHIGVSPWYWWADVPVRQQPDLFVLPGCHTRGEPTVR